MEDAASPRPSTAAGYELLEQQQAVRALAVFDALLRDDADNTDARLGRAAALLGMGEQQFALSAYDAVLAIEPDNAEALHQKAITLLWLHRYEEALEIVEQQLTVTPDDAELWLTRGTILACLEKWYDAADALAVAVEYDLTNADVWIHKGRIHLHQGLPGEALTAFDRALALQPHSRAACKGKWAARRAWVVTYVWHVLPDLLGA